MHASVALLLMFAFILRLMAASLREVSLELKPQEIKRNMDAVRW